MPPVACVRFSHVARLLAAAARAEGLHAPGFRSPPRVPGADRTIRRWPQGAVVSVRLRDRPFADVVGDMVEGVVTANRLHGERAERCRRRLRAAVPNGLDARADPAALPPPGTVAGRPGGGTGQTQGA